MSWLSKLAIALAIMIIWHGTSWSVPIYQVDQITVQGPYYRGDKVTLNVDGPFPASVAYTVTPDDEVGYNALNVALHWFNAIAADPFINSILTAAFASPLDAVGPNPLFITLTAKTPGKPFYASVSATEACDCDFNETAPIIASIDTIVSARIPEPSTLALLFVGLAGLLGTRRRRKESSSGPAPRW